MESKENKHKLQLDTKLGEGQFIEFKVLRDKSLQREIETNIFDKITDKDILRENVQEYVIMDPGIIRIAEKIALSFRSIEWNLKKLKVKNIIIRIGPK